MFIYVFVFTLKDSGLESDYIQDDVLIGNGDNSPTVEDGTQQDETKNGHLGNFFFYFSYFNVFLFVSFCYIEFYFYFYFDVFFFFIVADADIGDDAGKTNDG